MTLYELFPYVSFACLVEREVVKLTQTEDRQDDEDICRPADALTQEVEEKGDIKDRKDDSPCE